MTRKIKSPRVLKTLIRNHRRAGKKVVFTNGCFDLVHYGHVQYLEKAKRTGDILVVGVNSDSSVKRIKGNGRPIVRQRDRARVIAALECVDYVTLFAQSTPYSLIKKLTPDILVKGADWKKKDIIGSDAVIRAGGKVVTIPLAHGRSTTGLLKKIAKLRRV